MRLIKYLFFVLSSAVFCSSAAATPRISWIESGDQPFSNPELSPPTDNFRDAHLSGRDLSTPRGINSQLDPSDFKSIGSRYIAAMKRGNSYSSGKSISIDLVDPSTGVLETLLNIPNASEASLAGAGDTLFVLACVPEANYGCDLFRVDLHAGTFYRLTQFGAGSMALVFDQARNSLYAFSGGSLVSIDATSGASTVIRSHDASRDLALDSSGNFLVTTSSDELVKIAISGGALTTIYTIPTDSSLFRRIGSFVERSPGVYFLVETRYRVIGGRVISYIPTSTIAEINSGIRTPLLTEEENVGVEELKISSDDQWLFWRRVDNGSAFVGGKLSENLNPIWQVYSGWPYELLTETSDDTVRILGGGDSNYSHSLVTASNQQSSCCNFVATQRGLVDPLLNKYAYDSVSKQILFLRPAEIGNFILRASVDGISNVTSAATPLRTTISDLRSGRQSGDLYYSDRAGIYRKSSAGLESQVVATSTAVATLTVTSDESHVYWIEDSGTIRSIRQSDAFIATLPFALPGATEIEVDQANAKVFISDGTSVFVRNLDGTGTQTLFDSSGPDSISGLKVDDVRKRIYFVAAKRIRGTDYLGVPSDQLEGITAGDVQDIDISEALPTRARTTRLDYDGDGVSNYVIYRQPQPTQRGYYFIRAIDGSAVIKEAHKYRSVPVELGYSDYNSPQDAEVVVGNSGNGLAEWALSTYHLSFWGVAGDKLTPEDFDGNHLDNMAVYRPRESSDSSPEGFSNWYVLSTQRVGGFAEQWGLSTDIPAPADFDNDGLADFVVYRPSFGMWYVKNSGFSYGATDHETDVYQWGLPGDIPLPADMNNDGYAELIVWRPSTGTWYIRDTRANSWVEKQWGLPGDIPLLTDFNGDGLLELTVYREKPFGSPGPLWYTNFLNGQTKTVQWGLVNDKLPLRVAPFN